MSEALGITKNKEKEFSEWYTEVVQKAELADYGPVEGTIVYRPTSYAIWEMIQNWYNARLRAHGVSNTYFPMFIPERFLHQEAEHFKGFAPEVMWVTQGGDSKLGEKLALRPTSETIMYTMFSKWIRSWRDLPLRINQWCNVVRWETKATKPFLRGKEFLWSEVHTAHASNGEAEEEAIKGINYYRELFEKLLAIPVVVGRKSDREKFAGADTTFTIEAIMPDGKALQSGTSHNLGQNFSKPFNVQYLDKNEKKQNVWQTSWGISTRVLGALVMVHGDSKGLVLPPEIAPTQVVIVPIYKTESRDAVLKEARELERKLSEFRVHLDTREQHSPGFKFNEWEMKGVPLRVEIGPKDIEKKSVMLARRDSGKKDSVAVKDLAKIIKSELGDIQKNLFRKAEKLLEEMTHEVKDIKEFKKILEKQRGFIVSGWCGSSGCEDKIKDDTGATIRVLPFDQQAHKKHQKCVHCSKPAKYVAYFARAY